MDRKTRELIKIRQEMQKGRKRQVNNPNMGNGCIKGILIFGLLL